MLNRQKHRKVLFEVLRKIYNSPYSYALGFKGGTMLYFFHDLDRMSVDLDFDLLDSGEVNNVYEFFKKTLKKYGQIEDEKDKKNTLLFLLRYEKDLAGIKVEVSKRPQESANYEFRDFYGTQVKCLKGEDAFASKLVATLERKSTAGRDFYDIYFFLKNGYDLNEDIVEARTGMSTGEYLNKLRSFVDKNLTNKIVMTGVGELVDEDKKKWIRLKFKEELLAQLDFFLKER